MLGHLGPGVEMYSNTLMIAYVEIYILYMLLANAIAPKYRPGECFFIVEYVLKVVLLQKLVNLQSCNFA